MAIQAGFGSEGPSWADISLTIQHLHATHGLTVSVVVSSTGSNFTGACSVMIKAVAPVLVGPGRVWEAENTAEFPSHRHKTLEGLVYRLLLEMDLHASNTLYKQLEFA